MKSSMGKLSLIICLLYPCLIVEAAPLAGNKEAIIEKPPIAMKSIQHGTAQGENEVFVEDTDRRIQGRILNGAKLPETRIHNIALLVNRFSDGQFTTCTGTLISTSLILTAAHCLIPKPGQVASLKNSYALVGEKTTNIYNDDPGRENRYNYTNGWVPARYNPEIFALFDIALIRLNRNVSSEHGQVVSIGSAPPAGQVVYPSGYGLYEFAPGLGSIRNSEPQYARNTVRSCTEVSPSVFTDVGHLCFTDLIQKSCKGDSGGPVFRISDDGQLSTVGVISFYNSDSSCSMAKYSGSTRISPYIDWIREVDSGVFSSSTKQAFS